MLTVDQLKQAVHKKKITKTDAALLCVAAGGAKEVPTAMVRQLAIEAGVKGAKTIQYYSHLAAAEDKVFKAPKGWELTGVGRAHVAGLAAAELAASPAAAEAQTLRALLPKLKNQHARAFITEAIVCSEQNLFRAAVVLSWVGAMALLQQRAVAKHLAAINAEALKRNNKWKPAKTADDLGRLREADFLEIATVVSMITKNVKQELDGCLKLRNSCGHPNSFQIGPNKVAAHLETLTQNVYATYR